MKADYHMHTSFSDDSQFVMEDEIKTAIARGLEEICFTEHIDHLEKIHQDAELNAYQKEFIRLKEKYKNQIQMKFGAEFGMQRHTIDLFEKDFQSCDFDFVLLSCHQINDLEFWNQGYQKGKTQKEINEGYYQEILYCVEHYRNYCVLGHLDAIKRDDPYGEYEDEKVWELLTKILKKVIADGKGIEVNTSNFRYGLSDLTPSRKILKLYYDLGGKILTFGSDSHKEEHVGYKIEEVKEEVKKIGFKEFYTFEKMKPIAHLL